MKSIFHLQICQIDIILQNTQSGDMGLLDIYLVNFAINFYNSFLIFEKFNSFNFFLYKFIV